MWFISHSSRKSVNFYLRKENTIHKATESVKDLKINVIIVVSGQGISLSTNNQTLNYSLDYSYNKDGYIAGWNISSIKVRLNSQKYEIKWNEMKWHEKKGNETLVVFYCNYKISEKISYS